MYIAFAHYLLCCDLYINMIPLLSLSIALGPAQENKARRKCFQQLTCPLCYLYLHNLYARLFVYIIHMTHMKCIPNVLGLFYRNQMLQMTLYIACVQKNQVLYCNYKIRYIFK